MQQIIFFIPLTLPNENQLQTLLKRRLVGNGARAGSLYGGVRKKALLDTGLLIRQYFRKHGDDVPALPKGTRCRFRFEWFPANKKIDPDNIASGGTKIILDALRLLGVLANDGWSSYVENDVAIEHVFNAPNATRFGVEVRIHGYAPGEEPPPR